MRQWIEGMRNVGTDQTSVGARAYEHATRTAVLAAIEWFEANPTSSPTFLLPSAAKAVAVIGAITDINAAKNDDAKAMLVAIVSAVEALGGGPPSIMQTQCAVSHAFFVHAKGWDAWVAHMQQPRENAPGGQS